MSDLTAAIARVRAATTFADGEPMPDGALPHDDFYCGELRTLIAAAERAAAQVAWQPIATAPEGRVVLVFYKNQLGNGRTMRARYYLPETLESEQTESGWADEGWYEESEAYEYLMPLEHEPTHWMPMPAAPDAAAPAQAEPQPVSVPYELLAHDKPQPAPTPNPGPIGSSLGVAAPDVAALVEPPADALVEDESIADMLTRHDKEVRAAIRRTHDRMIGAEAKRDAVERQMQTFNVVVQERDAKIVAAVERADRAEAALAEAEGREKALREALAELVACKDLKERIDAIVAAEECNIAYNQRFLEWQELTREYSRRKPLAWSAARAALARKEGE